MVGAYLVAFIGLTTVAPVALAVAAAVDVVRRRRFGGTRLLVLVWAYLLAELVGVVLATWLWVRHRAWAHPRSAAFIAANYRLQHHWARALLGAARRVLRLQLEVDGLEHVMPGPVVVLMRHTSLIDTVLPVVLLGGRGLRLRYVLKRELRLDPCLDIVGGRLPNYFVDRGGSTEREAEAVGQLAQGLGPSEGVLIYPEGTRFSAAKQKRVLASLRERDPAAHDRAASLRHVLPPRPAGTLALLDQALPQHADVLVMTHTGLERVTRLRDVLRGDAVGTQVRVAIWRIDGKQVPTAAPEQRAWLFEQWQRVDEHAARVQ